MTRGALADAIASGAGRDSLTAPMIPGTREPGVLTTFGVPDVVIPGGPTTMDAATIAVHQKEGGGAPNQRRRARHSRWNARVQRLRRFATTSRQR